MNINYLGGIAVSGTDEKVLQMRLTHFLDTANLVETDNCIIDVDNMFKRKFMCCRDNCDFYAYESHSNKGLFDVNKGTFYDKACCLGGSLEISDELIENIDNHLDGILEFCDDECAEQIKKSKAGWKKVYKENKITYTNVGSLKKDNRCLFTFVEDGMPMCALHRYALSIGENVLKFKPFECYMYPLDFIEIVDRGKTLITTIDITTQGFLRWGDVHLGQKCQYSCEHGEVMYKYGKDVIVSVLGRSVYDEIDKAFQNGTWK